MQIVKELLKQFKLEIKEKLSDADYLKADKVSTYLLVDKNGWNYSAQEFINLVYYKSFKKDNFTFSFGKPFIKQINLSHQEDVIYIHTNEEISLADVIEANTYVNILDSKKEEVISQSNAVDSWLKERITELNSKTAIQVIIKDGKCNVNVPVSAGQPGNLSFNDITLNNDAHVSCDKDKVTFAFNSNSLVTNVTNLNNFLKKYNIKWQYDNLITEFLLPASLNKELSNILINILYDNTIYPVLPDPSLLLLKLKDIINNKGIVEIEEIRKELIKINYTLPGDIYTQNILLCSILKTRGEDVGIKSITLLTDYLRSMLPFSSDEKEELYHFDKWLDLAVDDHTANRLSYAVHFKDEKGRIFYPNEIFTLIRALNLPNVSKLTGTLSSLQNIKIKNTNYNKNANILSINLDSIIPYHAIDHAEKLLSEKKDKEKNLELWIDILNTKPITKETKNIPNANLEDLSHLVFEALGESGVVVTNKDPVILIKDTEDNLFSLNEIDLLFPNNIINNIAINKVYYDAQYNEIVATINQKIDIDKFLSLLKEYKFAISDKKSTSALLRRSVSERFDKISNDELNKINEIINTVININDIIISFLQQEILKDKRSEILSILKDSFDEFVSFLSKEASFEEMKQIVDCLEESSNYLPFKNEQLTNCLEQIKKIKDQKAKDKSFHSSEYTLNKLNMVCDIFNNLKIKLNKIEDSKSKDNIEMQPKKSIHYVDENHISKILDEILNDLTLKINEPISIEKKSEENIVVEIKNQDKILSEPEQAAYRIGARKISNSTHDILVQLLKSQNLSSTSIKAFQELFNSKYGKAMLSYISGLSLNKITDNDKVNLLADELKIEGMSSGIELVLDGLLDLRVSKPSSKIRVAEYTDVVEETEEEQEESKTSSFVSE